MRKVIHIAFALSFAFAASAAQAADDRFDKTQGAMYGFLAATDPVYVKECGSCHFAYSPGVLPKRSWERHLERLDKHFGESVQLNPQTLAAVRRYLTENAADVSQYEGSKIFMERIDANTTPFRFQDIPRFRTMHRIVLEVITIKPKVKVRKLTNCNGCHQEAETGSYALNELLIPGLTPTRH
jgi:diheme cytochrome c